MNKLRLRFKKEGSARFISHLDLMRTFQRSMARAEIAVKHTEGFNPHPHISIAHPLPVGFCGEQEILDFTELKAMPMEEITVRLNASLPSGISINCCYSAEKGVKEIVLAKYRIIFRFRDKNSTDAARELDEFFSNAPIMVMKRTKKGEKETDIAPDISSFIAHDAGKDCVVIETSLVCGESFLNPMYLTKALEMSGFAAIDRASYLRTGFFNADGREFL